MPSRPKAALAVVAAVPVKPPPRGRADRHRASRSLPGPLPSRRRLLLAAGALAASPALCSASAARVGAPTAAPGPGATQQPTDPNAEIVVTGYRFLDADTSGITNLPLSIEQVPQSVSLINNDFARAADLKNLGEVAQHTPGGIFASYSPSYGNQFWLRGFPANYAVDGVLVGDQITEPDVATLQRYEIVKGPASVVYGAQSPGGVVNLVAKPASPNTPSYLQALGGSFGRRRLEGQAGGSLNATGTIRAIGVAAHEQGGSFVDFVHLDKTVAYGGLDFDIGPRLTAYVRGSYQRTRDTPFNGIPTFPKGTLVPVSRSYFLGGSDVTNLTQAERSEAGLSWKPSELWSVDLQAVYQHTTHGGGNVYNYDYVADDGSFPVGGEKFDDWHVEDFTIAGSATRKLDDLGLVESYVVASVRYQHYRYYIAERNLTGGSTNIFSGDGTVSDFFNALTPVPGGYQQDQRMNYVTGSVQAVVKVASPLTLVGGIAYSSPKIDLQLYDGAFRNFDPGHQLNYRAATILEPIGGLNLYASYGESYQPNLRIDTNHDVLPPVKGKQYEVGAKYLVERHLLLTAALFDIRESNVAVYDMMVDGEALYRAAGVRHRGLELEATGQISHRWQVKSGVALLNAKVRQDPEHPVDIGERRPWLPKVTADIYTSYDFRNGFSLGGGLRFVGDVKTYDTFAAPTPALSSYALFDAGAGYSFECWHLQLNLKNLSDRHYRVSTPIFQSLSAGLYPGEPRSFAVSVRRDF